MTGQLRYPAYEVPRKVTDVATVLLCRNPGSFELEGTNTWLLRAPGESGCVVVDPGPDDEVHLRAVADAAGRVDQVLLTHRHHDHAGGARRFHALTGAPVRALDPTLRLGGEGFAAGAVVAAAGVEIRVLATPGHTSDSLCFTLPGMVLTGDTILGRGTSVVAHPDGVLADYLESLRRLRELGAAMVLPGHGPELADAGTVAEQYLRHRAERLDQVRAAVAAHRTEHNGTVPTAMDVVRRVYVDVDEALWPAAVMSVRAQLDYLGQL